MANREMDWWLMHLEEYESDGAKDATKGEFLLPHPGSTDPQDESENAAYERGFKRKRLELGDKFQWK